MTPDRGVPDRNSLNVYEAYPVNTEWPDSGPSKRTIRITCAITVLVVAAAVAVGVWWWPPAGFILGVVLGSLFAANVKMSLRPQWPF